MCVLKSPLATLLPNISRCLVFAGMEAVSLSSDHVLKNPDELLRIQRLIDAEKGIIFW